MASLVLTDSSQLTSDSKHLEKEQIFNSNDNSTVTSSTYSEVAEDSPTVNAESKFQDDSEWSDCEWNSDLNSSESVSEDQQEMHYPVAELQEELNKKNSRWSANQVRTTERLKQMGAENARLKHELETLRKEKEQNNKLTKQSKPKQVQKKSSEGSFMETIFDNGDIEQKFEDKNLVKYYYASTSTWQTTEADGTEIFEFPNGQIERHYKDNSKEVTFPDGSVKLVHSRGQEEWKLPDRTLLTIGALGEKRREYPDGTVKIVFPDGRQETHYPNGRLRIKDAKGNLILDLIETK
uniref:Centromere protein J C-terminal domain-containing protein n=1 Tax=Timema shepardi TaxID=629360 RepID=A0A7R9APY2_TIMSH|nr:unnamed protein product [Timema shepardi]